MEETIKKLHREILAAINFADDTNAYGALVIVGSEQGKDKGNITSFSGGNGQVIAMGLLREMLRDPAVADIIRIALAMYEEQISQSN